MSTNNERKLVPHVKENMPKDEWQKRINSPLYRKRVKRMVALLKSCQPQANQETAAQSHYWLDSAQPDDTRRLRSPSERSEEKESTLKDSVKY